MPIINQKGMDNIMKNTKIELGMEELELVNGGWNSYPFRRNGSERLEQRRLILPNRKMKR